MIIFMWKKLFSTPHCKVDRFRHDRTRLSDEQFLTECNIEPESDLARVAIAVRRCVADVGLVDSAFVQPSDTFPGTLDVLPLWDSMDFIDLILRIERELDVILDQRKDFELFAIPFSVFQLVRRVYVAVESADS